VHGKGVVLYFLIEEKCVTCPVTKNAKEVLKHMAKKILGKFLS
jgi:hypothetical protein